MLRGANARLSNSPLSASRMAWSRRPGHYRWSAKDEPLTPSRQIPRSHSTCRPFVSSDSTRLAGSHELCGLPDSRTAGTDRFAD